MKVVVIGLSPTAALYKPDLRLRIGVNDVEKYHKVNHLIVIDKITAFTQARLNTIKNSTPDVFLSNLEEWNFMQQFKKINFANCRSHLDQIETENVYPYSIMSPYIAIVHAYKIGAKEITLYGVDINDHKTLSDPIKKDRILRDIKALYLYLKKKNVNLLVYNKSSLLSSVLEYLSDE